MSREASQPPGRIVEVLVSEGLITQEQLRYAQRAHSKLTQARPLLNVMTELGYVSDEQIRDVMGDRRVDSRIGDLLVELGLLRDDDLQIALELQAEEPDNKKRLGEILLEQHFIEEAGLTRVLASQLGYAYCEPHFEDLDETLLRHAPTRWFATHEFVPVSRRENDILVAFADPMNARHLAAAEAIFTHGNVVPAMAPREAIQEAVRTAERRRPGTWAVAHDDVAIAEILNEVLDTALERGASDIHIEPDRDHLHIRFRCDGRLVTFREYPPELSPGLLRRVQNLCGGELEEGRRHASATLTHGPQNHELEAFLTHTVDGDRLRLRLPSWHAQRTSLIELGLAPGLAARLARSWLAAGSGLVLLAGPRRAGKTATLHACLAELTSSGASALMLETGPHHSLDGVAQIALHRSATAEYLESLRALPDQDADVLALDALEDGSAVDAASRCANAGHTVLAETRARDGLGALLSLLGRGCDSYALASSLVGIVAQHLLPGLCEACTEDYAATALDLRRLGYRAEELGAARFRRGRGCVECAASGASGRVAIFELVEIGDEARDALVSRAMPSVLRERLGADSVVTLMEDALVGAAEGRVTLTELIRRVRED